MRKPREYQLRRKRGGGGRERGRTFPPPQTTTQLMVKRLTKEAHFLYLERRKRFSH
jgi:hypothetical protein